MKNVLSGVLMCLTVAVLVVGVTGCGGGVDVAGRVGDKNKTNIQKLLNLITLHQKRTNKAADSPEMLREWLDIADNIAQNLELMDIDKDKLDDFLVSERDGEPFDVRWGTYQAMGAASEPYIFEKIGVEGLRQVIWTGGKITEVDEDEYDKLRKGKFERSGKRGG